MTTFTTQDRQDAERVTQESWMAGVRALAAIIDSHLIASKPLNKWLAPKPLTDEKIMEIYYSVWNQPMEMEDIERADITFARAIERAHGIGE